MGERLEITNQDVMNLSAEDWKWTQFTNQYWVRLLRFANECGLKGRRIKEIRGYEMLARGDIRYIDFICEDA